MKKSFVAGMALAILALFGCSDPYGACVKADQDIAQGISTGLDTVLKLQQQGQISASEALDIAGYLEYANKADESFGKCVKTAHTSGGTGLFTVCAGELNSNLNNPIELSLIHVSNPQASQNVSVVINGITTGAQLLIAALGGK